MTRGRKIGACIVAVAAALLALGLWHSTALPTGADEVPSPHLGYGVNLRYLSNVDSIFVPLGFDWIKVYERFDTMPTERLPYHVLYRIDLEGNRWSWQEGHWRPDPDKIRADVREVAQEGWGLVDAYEIGNEPNTDWWEGQPPDPADYVRALQAAYEAIKEVDPGAIVVSAGLAPVGRIGGPTGEDKACTANSGETYLGNDCRGMDERLYAREMFERGAGNYFDAFGYHPTGFAYPPELSLDQLPEHDNGNGFAFRGAEVIHAIMEDYDLGAKPIWATEFGWLRDPSEDGFGWCHTIPVFEDNFGWMDVPEVQQANYLTRAFQYADEHWPWMGAMFIWAFDFHKQGAECWSGRYFSVRRYNGPEDEEGTPTLAYPALISMTKWPGHFGPRLVVEPTALTFLTDVDEPCVSTATLMPLNTSYRVLTWTATVAAGMPLTPTLVITTGFQGTPLTVTVDSAGYNVGVFTGTITVTSPASDVLGAPKAVSVVLQVRLSVPRLTVTPAEITFLADVDEPGVFTITLTPLNTGYRVLTWTATVAAGMPLTPTLVITTGLQGTPLTVTVDSTGYPTGTFTGSITVTATTTDVLDAPQAVPVTLLVVPEMYRVYLPIVLRSAP